MTGTDKKEKLKILISIKKKQFFLFHKKPITAVNKNIATMQVTMCDFNNQDFIVIEAQAYIFYQKIP